MKNLREINLKKAYDSDRDNLLRDFFIPALSAAKTYKRLTGFFSSGILAAAARGVAGLITNNGKMSLIVGAQVHDEDLAAIQRATSDPESYVEKILSKELDGIEKFLTEEHVEALGWMLANDLLEIKIGLVTSGGMFHMKVGIIEDATGDKLSFSGSDNETPSGWKHNIEEFKVFRGWMEDERGWFAADEEKFERFWNKRSDKVVIVDLPDAIRQRMIRSIPKRKEDLKIFKKREKDGLPPIKTSTPTKPRQVVLRKHQQEAISAWVAKGFSGILSMATGSGKTKTSLAIVDKITADTGAVCAVVALPYAHLVGQWIEKDIRPQFPEAAIVEVHGEAHGWRDKIKLYLDGFKAGTFKQLFIVGLYHSLASDDFISIFRSRVNKKLNYLLIADEAHNLGATENQKAMLPEFNMRLGLSATPSRHFDEDGTAAILNYFGGVAYEYTLKQAIADGHLVHYDYHPIPVTMTQEEYEEYISLSSKIRRGAAASSAKHEQGDSFRDNAYLQKLLLERSRIIKKSANKLQELSSILAKMKSEGRIKNLLIYCDDLHQMERVKVILDELGLLYQKFTEKESLQERSQILTAFARGEYQCLIAIKCLDEGVDMPSVKSAIILASTTNPREYIQRRGRVLRKDPDDATKQKATIYDFIVLPPVAMEPALMRIEKGILKKEFSRVKDFLESADNKSAIYETLLEIMSRYGVSF